MRLLTDIFAGTEGNWHAWYSQLILTVWRRQVLHLTFALESSSWLYIGTGLHGLQGNALQQPAQDSVALLLPAAG